MLWFRDLSGQNSKHLMHSIQYIFYNSDIVAQCTHVIMHSNNSYAHDLILSSDKPCGQLLLLPVACIQPSHTVTSSVALQSRQPIPTITACSLYTAFTHSLSLTKQAAYTNHYCLRLIAPSTCGSYSGYMGTL